MPVPILTATASSSISTQLPEQPIWLLVAGSSVHRAHLDRMLLTEVAALAMSPGREAGVAATGTPKPKPFNKHTFPSFMLPHS